MDWRTMLSHPENLREKTAVALDRLAVHLPPPREEKYFPSLSAWLDRGRREGWLSEEEYQRVCLDVAINF